VIRHSGLSKAFGARVAVDDLNLHVPRGEICGLELGAWSLELRHPTRSKQRRAFLSLGWSSGCARLSQRNDDTAGDEE
jgi:hypothetical protein